MTVFSTLLGNVVLFALLLVPGFVLGKLRLIERGALNSMTNALMYVAMPALVLSKLFAIDLRVLSAVDVIVCAAAPVVAVGVGLLLAVLLFRRRDGDTRWRVGRYCAVFSNCGFLGIPLADVLFPDRPEVALCVSLFNVVSTFFLLTLGIYILSGDRRHIRVRSAVISPIGVAIVLGVVLSLTGVGARVPAIGQYTGYLAALTTPLSMLVLGVQLSAMRFSAFFKTVALVWCALVKLLLVPICVMLMLFGLRLCGVEVGQAAAMAVFISTAVSTAASAPAMSQKYGSDGEHAAVLTLGTTILCVVTLPLVYALLTVTSLL